MTTKRKKGSSYTPPAQQRHWYGRKQSEDTRRGDGRQRTAGGAGDGRQRTGAGPGDSRQRTAGPGGGRAGDRTGDRGPRAAGQGTGRTGSRERSGRRAAPGRDTTTAELVTGRNPVLEALRGGVPASALYVAHGETDERVRTAVSLAGKAGMRILESGRAELDRRTDGAVHQGIVLEVRPYRYRHPADLLSNAERSGRPPLIVALDQITDPRNLGAIARSAAAFGAHGLVIPQRRAAAVTAGAWKASAGALARIDVARATNLSRTLAEYQSAGLFVVGLAADGDTPLADLALADEPLVLVVGSEGRGLGRLVTEHCDTVAAIAMTSATESLNAGVAAGVALHEIAGKRAARAGRDIG